MKHPHEAAINLLVSEAQDYYEEYLLETESNRHEAAKRDYDRYVELNTAAQFLAQNLPSGVLQPSEVTPVFVAPTLPSRFPSTSINPT